MTPARPGCPACHGTGKEEHRDPWGERFYTRCSYCRPSLGQRLREFWHSLKWRAATAVILYLAMRV